MKGIVMAVGGPAPHDAAGTAGNSPEHSPEPFDRAPANSPEPVGRASTNSPEPVGRAPAIRPFLLTAGRVSGGGTALPIPIETQVVSTSAGLSVLHTLTFEHRDIIAACRQPQSAAELAAQLRLHLNVVRVLAEDLCAAGHLAIHRPNAGAAQDLSVLRRVIDGLRAVPDSRGTLRDSG